MKRKAVGIIVGSIIGLLLICGGCAKKQITETEVQPPAPGAVTTEPSMGEPGQEEGVTPKRVPIEGLEAEVDSFENELIYFDFDKFSLTPESIATLNKKAAFLKANAKFTIEIQGHCDERGTSEYNMALGERRAKAAADYLMSQGVSSDKITTVSYGEERPLDPSSNEETWAKNRRDQFVITNK
ncbi:MAG TPA: peptidoglycan-associated lipoprotein Pal [Deltaproteobacteria bacterium]|nr:peptidoglycan-associated lipoprotein Pal [Deltaproteobacteria bacterium]